MWTQWNGIKTLNRFKNGKWNEKTSEKKISKRKKCIAFRECEREREEKSRCATWRQRYHCFEAFILICFIVFFQPKIALRRSQFVCECKCSHSNRTMNSFVNTKIRIGLQAFFILFIDSITKQKANQSVFFFLRIFKIRKRKSSAPLTLCVCVFLSRFAIYLFGYLLCFVQNGMCGIVCLVSGFSLKFRCCFLCISPLVLNAFYGS